jgi:hypothetical protein
MKPCKNCLHPLASHRGYRQQGGDEPGCLMDGCACEEFRPREGIHVKISDQQKAFARTLVGQHQKVILKHRQMIDDIKREFGLNE